LRTRINGQISFTAMALAAIGLLAATFLKFKLTLRGSGGGAEAFAACC
jgi:hypothetical protein